MNHFQKIAKKKKNGYTKDKITQPYKILHPSFQEASDLTGVFHLSLTLCSQEWVEQKKCHSDFQLAQKWHRTPGSVGDTMHPNREIVCDM